MRNRTLKPSAIRRRLVATGLPHTIVMELNDTVVRWLNSGEEWAVKRIKSIKQDIILARATGAKPQTPWVAKTRSGNLKGIFGTLLTLALQSDKMFRRVLQAMNISSAFVSETVTDSQRRKFLDSAMTKRAETPKSYREGIVEGLYLRVAPFGVGGEILASPYFSEHQEPRLMAELKECFSSPKGREILIDYHDVVGPAVLRSVGFTPRSRSKTTLGEVLVTQEPGFKARFYLQPHLWLQHVLEPMKKALMGYLTVLPWDGTHDQRVADEHIKARLSSGGLVHSFDLSDATNLFPLDLQMDVLRRICHPDDMRVLEFFEYVARSEYGFEDGVIRWTRGQALGLGPSFPMFALTHGHLLRYLNGGNHDDKFFVIGDDVVILDNDLADKYRQALDDLELDYSPHKTLVSDQVAEFAGMLFTRKEQFRVPKWKGLRGENLLDLAMIHGPGFLKVLPKRWQPFVEWWLSLPEPLGIGHNPKGLSLDERMTGVIDLYWPEDDEPAPADTSPMRRVWDRIFREANNTDRTSREFMRNARMSREFVQAVEQTVEHAVQASSAPVVVKSLARIAPDLLPTFGVHLPQVAQRFQRTTLGGVGKLETKVSALLQQNGHPIPWMTSP